MIRNAYYPDLLMLVFAIFVLVLITKRTGTLQVFGTTSLLTSPTLLESTSLVLSFGTLDLFLSTISPSSTFDILSEGFNKVQLIMTIIALGVGIGVVRPIVRRKGLKARWY
jgi:Na+/H+ antiporter NhaC